MEEVSAGASFTSAAEVERCAAAASADVHSAKMAREASFQHSKLYLHKVQSYLDGVLLESEVDPDLVEVAEAFRSKQQATDRTRVAKEARSAALLAPQAPDIRHQPVFVEPGSQAAGLPELAGFHIVTSRCDAAFFAVNDPASPGQRTLWSVVLSGGTVVDSVFLRTKGREGVAFTYDAATATKRSVFLCPDFTARFPCLSSIVTQAAEKPGSRWSLLRSWEDFASASAAASGPQVPVRQRRCFDVVAITVARTSAALNVKNVFCKASIIPFLRRVACTQRGLG